MLCCCDDAMWRYVNEQGSYYDLAWLPKAASWNGTAGTSMGYLNLQADFEGPVAGLYRAHSKASAQQSC